jgi:Lar family restriction alleviation protein
MKLRIDRLSGDRVVATEEYEARSCPFCGSENLYLDASIGHLVARVECGNCAAIGPHGIDTDLAVKAWNGRVDA